MSAPATIISFQVLGVGAWGPKFSNWSELSSLLLDDNVEFEDNKSPKPEIIPANERRRAPLPVKLAVESSWQAVQNAKIDPVSLISVFVSGLGDTQLTDYMCRALIGPNKALSPTKFHNSVHNAAAGYWTISTGCMQAANSIAGFQKSVPLTLLEAIIQSKAEQRPVLLTFYDAPSSDVLHDLMRNEVSFSASIIINAANQRTLMKAPVYNAIFQQSQVDWPKMECSDDLLNCYETNPAARILPLLHVIAENSVGSQTLQYPISSETSLKIETQ